MVGTRPRTHEEQLERIQSIADAALAHLELEDLLDELLLRIRDALETDTAAILLLDEATNELVARAAAGLEESVAAGTRVPVGRGFAGRVAAERRIVALDDVPSADIVNPILREKGLKSLLGAPLVVGGSVLGIVHVGTLQPRQFTDDDAELLQLAADRAALAIDHGRAYAAAVSAAERLARLQAVTDTTLDHLTTASLLDELVLRVREILETDTCAVLLVDEEREDVVARAAAGLEEEVEAGVRIPLGRGFAGRIAAERRVVFIEDVDHADVFNPILREKGIKSLLGAPLLAHGRVLGVIHVGTLQPRLFTEDDVALLQAAAERAALGLERALLHERLLELDRVRNRFVAVAAHELRTPATAILGSALTLHAREHTLAEDDRAALLELLVGQSQRLAALLEQLLDLSKLETHAVPIRRERRRVADLVAATLAELAPEHREDVRVDVEPALEVEADATAVERILSNLLVNALRHGRPPVLVSARRDAADGRVRLVVEDAGEGVPADVRPRVFEQFTRSESAAGKPGSGLGLAIARSYARAHGGELELLENGGPGARFQLVLPG
jgi:signal transduction histidine kinase